MKKKGKIFFFVLCLYCMSVCMLGSFFCYPSSFSLFSFTFLRRQLFLSCRDLFEFSVFLSLISFPLCVPIPSFSLYFFPRRFNYIYLWKIRPSVSRYFLFYIYYKTRHYQRRYDDDYDDDYSDKDNDCNKDYVKDHYGIRKRENIVRQMFTFHPHVLRPFAPFFLFYFAHLFSF